MATEKPRRGPGCFTLGCLTLLVVLFLAVVAGALIGFRSSTSTETMQASIRVAEGTAEVRHGPAGAWQRAENGTILSPGDAVRVPSGSVVLVNYFEGSVSRLDGPAELVLQDATLVSRQPGLLAPLLARLRGQAAPVTETDTKVNAKGVLGKITTKVAKLGSPASSFDLEGPNSIAGVQGTILELVVEPDGTAYWRSIEGQVQVGAVMVDQNSQTVAVVIPLTAGALATIPPLPPQFQNNQAMVDQLIGAAREIVHETIRLENEGGNVGQVDLKDRALLGVGTDNGVAVFNLQKVADNVPPTPTPVPGASPTATSAPVATHFPTPIGTPSTDRVTINIPGFVFFAGTPTPAGGTVTPTPTLLPGVTPSPTPTSLPGVTPTPDLFGVPGERTITLTDGAVAARAQGELNNAPDIAGIVGGVSVHINPGRTIFVSTGIASGAVQLGVSAGRVVVSVPPGLADLASRAIGKAVPTSVDVTGYIGLPGGATVVDLQTGNGFLTVYYR